MHDDEISPSALRFIDGPIASELLPALRAQEAPVVVIPSVALTTCPQACPTQMCPTVFVTSCPVACPTQFECPTIVVSSCPQMCLTMENDCLAPPEPRPAQLQAGAFF